MLLNTITYGTARVSRSAVYILVALWFGISSDTDSFFLTYATVTFVVLTISTTLGTVLIPHLGSISQKDLYLLLVIPILACLLGSFLLDSRLLLFLAPYTGFAIASSLLSGNLTSKGNFLVPPIVTIIGSLFTVTTALVFREQGLVGIAFGLSLGEVIRYILLWAFVDFSKVSGVSYKLIFPYLAIFGLFSLSPLTARIVAELLNEGYVTTLSYASGAVGILITFTTTGLIVTNGYVWKNLAPTKLVEVCGDSLLPRLKVSLIATLVVGVAGLVAFRFQWLYDGFFAESIYWNPVFGVFFILLVMVPMYTIVFNILPVLIILQKVWYLLWVAMMQLGLLLLGFGAALLYSPPFGLYSIAMILVIGEFWVAYTFFHSLWAERKQLTLEVA